MCHFPSPNKSFGKHIKIITWNHIQFIVQTEKCAIYFDNGYNDAEIKAEKHIEKWLLLLPVPRSHIGSNILVKFMSGVIKTFLQITVTLHSRWFAARFYLFFLLCWKHRLLTNKVNTLVVETEELEQLQSTFSVLIWDFNSYTIYKFNTSRIPMYVLISNAR